MGKDFLCNVKVFSLTCVDPVTRLIAVYAAVATLIAVYPEQC